MNNTLKFVFFINLLFFIYSLVSVLVKFAGLETTINFKFILFYGFSLFFMGIYAIFWQQVIKNLPLVIAFSNKAIVLVWGLLWGVLFFNETVTIGKIIGIGLVVSGVILFSVNKSGHKHNDSSKKEL